MPHDIPSHKDKTFIKTPCEKSARMQYSKNGRIIPISYASRIYHKLKSVRSKIFMSSGESLGVCHLCIVIIRIVQPVIHKIAEIFAPEYTALLLLCINLSMYDIVSVLRHIGVKISKHIRIYIQKFLFLSFFSTGAKEH